MNDAASPQVAALRPATESRTVRTRTANDAARGRKHLTRDEVHRLIRAAKKGRHGARSSVTRPRPSAVTVFYSSASAGRR